VADNSQFTMPRRRPIVNRTTKNDNKRPRQFACHFLHESEEKLK
jgi:hypothetical protein